MAGLKRTRRISSSRAVKKTKSLTKTQTQAVAKIAKRVDLRNAETKCLTKEWSESVQNTNTMAVVELTEIKQGSENDDRTGRQIIATGLRVKGAIHNNSFLEPVVVKLLLLQAKHAGVSDPASGTAMFKQSLHAEAESFASIGAIRAMYYDIDSSKYQVLGSKQWVLDASNNPNTGEDGSRHGGAGAVNFFNKYINLRCRKINYDGENTGTCLNKVFAIWMVVQPDNDQVVGDKIERTAVASLLYKDF
jgi:hypothetical protein